MASEQSGFVLSSVSPRKSVTSGTSTRNLSAYLLYARGIKTPPFKSLHPTTTRNDSLARHVIMSVYGLRWLPVSAAVMTKRYYTHIRQFVVSVLVDPIYRGAHFTRKHILNNGTLLIAPRIKLILSDEAKHFTFPVGRVFGRSTIDYTPLSKVIPTGALKMLDSSVSPRFTVVFHEKMYIANRGYKCNPFNPS